MRTRIMSRMYCLLIRWNRPASYRSVVYTFTTRRPWSTSVVDAYRPAWLLSAPRDARRIFLPRRRITTYSRMITGNAEVTSSGPSTNAANRPASPLVACATVRESRVANPWLSWLLSFTIRLTRSLAPPVTTVLSGRRTTRWNASRRMLVAVRYTTVSER